MTRSIDKRIVDMEFNNAQFEKGVGTSTKSLDVLKRGLNFDGASRGLFNLGRAAASMPFGSLASGVSLLGSRFSVLGIIGFEAVRKITGALINMGKQIFENVTGLAAIKSGMAEYETQINAIQTILANTDAKGTTLEQVKDALAELNEYADLTIYNFTEMTRNIGTFTAAGIDLDTSVEGIKGIANLAAVSGSNSQQASTAMYQLSQAISTGTVRLMDWNSVVNAGMGGEVFQKALKDSARVHGVAIDDIMEQENGFRNSLQKGWLTKEILLDSLAKFTGDLTDAELLNMGYTAEETAAIQKMGKTALDAATKVKTYTQLIDVLKESAQSGWTRSWELVLGDFDEAKILFTNISDTLSGLIGASADARNAVLQEWHDEGGRRLTIESIAIAFKFLLSVMDPIKEAFKEIFPPVTARQLIEIAYHIRKLADNLVLSGPAADKLKRTFKGLFALVDIGLEAFKVLAKVVWDAIKPFVPSLDSILNFTAGIGDFLVNLRDSIKETDFFGRAIGTLGGYLLSAKSQFASIINKVKSFGSSVLEAFAPAIAMIGTWFDSFSGVDFSMFDGLGEKMAIRFEPFTALRDLLKSVFGGIMDMVAKLAPGFWELGASVGDAIGSIGGFIAEHIRDLEFNSIVDVFNSGLLAALVLGMKRFVDGGADIFEGVADIVEEVGDSLQAWQQNLKAETLLKLAGALALLTISIVALSLIDSAKLTQAITAISILFAELVTAMGLFSKVSAGIGTMTTVVIGVLAMSVAVLLLAVAVSILAKLEWDALTRGLVGVGALAAMLVITAKTLSSGSGSMIKGAVGLIAFSIGINILVLAVKQVADMDPDKMEQGLVGIGILIAGIIAFLQLMGGGKRVISTAIGVGLLAIALNILAIAVEKLGNLDASVIEKGLIAIGILLAELSAFVNITGSAKKVIVTAVGLGIMAGAVNLLAIAMTAMGSLSLEEIKRGLIGIGGALTVLIAAMYLMPADMLVKSAALIGVSAALVILGQALAQMGSMSWDEIGRGLATLAGSLVILAVGLYLMSGTIAGSAALLIAAGAIALLAPALKTLGSMSLEEIGLALLALVGVLVVLGIAGLVMGPVIPVLLGLSAAMFLFGVAALAVGAGMMLFAVGLTAIAAGGTAGIATLALLITTVAGLLPMIQEQIGLALLVLLKTLVEAIPILIDVIKALFVGILEAVVEIIPPLMSAISLFVTTMLDTIVTLYPLILQAGYDLILQFLTGIRDNIPAIVAIVVEILLAFMEAISVNAPILLEGAMVLMTNLFDGIHIAIEERLPALIDSAFDLAIAFIDGISDGLDENLPELMIAIASMAANMIQGFADGITAGVGIVVEAVRQLASEAMNMMKSILGIESPSKVTKAFGLMTDAGLAVGIKEGIPGIVAVIKELAKTVTDEFDNSMGSALDVFGLDDTLSPVIRPVLDLSEIETGKKDIAGILTPEIGLNMSASAAQAEVAARGFDKPSASSEVKDTQPLTSEPAISLTQINNSPKALDRLEIYRQTRIQLLTLKGLKT